MYRFRLAWVVLAATLASPAMAAEKDFHAGKVIENYGRIASVATASALAPDTIFKVAFDIAAASQDGNINRQFDSVARFINMHAEAGVPLQNIQVAVVVHGAAALDLTHDAKRGDSNPNTALIAALIGAGARIELCGQTAAARDIRPDDLLPGVGLALSAMTAHALLQQDGYTLNPF